MFVIVREEPENYYQRYSVYCWAWGTGGFSIDYPAIFLTKEEAHAKIVSFLRSGPAYAEPFRKAFICTLEEWHGLATLTRDNQYDYCI